MKTSQSGTPEERLKTLSPRDVFRCARELLQHEARLAEKEGRERDVHLFNHLGDQVDLLAIRKAWQAKDPLLEQVQLQRERFLRKQDPDDPFIKLRIITGQK